MYEQDSKTGLRIYMLNYMKINQWFPNIMTWVCQFDRNVEPSEGSTVHRSLSLDQSILCKPVTGKSLLTSPVVAWDSVGQGDFFNLIKYYFAFKNRLKISDQKLLNFAECIAGKAKFCERGRKLRKKLRGQLLSSCKKLVAKPVT